MFHHLGFPVANRYVWGIYGSWFVILNRIMLSFGTGKLDISLWGILLTFPYHSQSGTGSKRRFHRPPPPYMTNNNDSRNRWVGGECLYVCLHSIFPDIETRIPNTVASEFGTTAKLYFDHFPPGIQNLTNLPTNSVCYVIFNIISLPLIWIHPHRLNKLLALTSALTVAFFITIFIWALATMSPAGLSFPPPVRVKSVGWTMVQGSISTVGAISTGILNNNDYTRFSRSPRDAFFGQVFSSPPAYIFCSMTGILVTAATQHRFPGLPPVWNLPQLLVLLQDNTPTGSTRAIMFFAGAALVASQLGINVGGNAMSGGFDISALWPSHITIRRGAYITALLSPAVNPWRLVNTATVFITVMGSYSVFLGPMVGLMVTSYYVIHRRKLKVTDL